METVKIMPEHIESQGPFVVINKCDFDPKRHILYEAKKPKATKPKAKK